MMARQARKRLGLEDRQEIARLYSETSTSIADIRERFGIPESSLYRVLQQQGVRRRGWLNRAATDGTTTQNSSRGAEQSGRSLGRTSRSGAHATVAGRRAASLKRAPARQYTVQFTVDQIFVAADLSDAVRQARLLGAMDIRGVSMID
jgi:transposase-like protein